MSEEGKSDHRQTFAEEIEVAGTKLVERVAHARIEIIRDEPKGPEAKTRGNADKS